MGGVSILLSLVPPQPLIRHRRSLPLLHVRRPSLVPLLLRRQWVSELGQGYVPGKILVGRHSRAEGDNYAKEGAQGAEIRNTSITQTTCLRRRAHAHI